MILLPEGLLLKLLIGCLLNIIIRLSRLKDTMLIVILYDSPGLGLLVVVVRVWLVPVVTVPN